MAYDFKVKLPSAGKAGYPGELTMRALTVREMKEFVGVVSENSGMRLSELLKKITDFADPDLLTLGDRDYLILMIRVNSDMDMVDLRYTCPSCGHKGMGSVDLKTVPVKELDSGTPKTIPYKSGESIVAMPQIGKDEILGYRLSLVIKDVEAIRLQVLATQLRSESSFEAALLKAKELLGRPAGYFTKLDNALLEFVHGPQWEEVHIKCRDCGFPIQFYPAQLFVI